MQLIIVFLNDKMLIEINIYLNLGYYMKKFFAVLGLLNISIMVLFALYYADGLNQLGYFTFDNSMIIEFVNRYIFGHIPNESLNNQLVTMIMTIIQFSERNNRLYVFAIYSVLTLINIITYFKILCSPSKDYFACILRLFFSPLTSLIGFIITIKKGKKNTNKYQADNNSYLNKNSNLNQCRTVSLKVPNKPIILTIFVAIIEISILAAISGVFVFGLTQFLAHACDFSTPFFYFIFGFIGLILIMVLVSLPKGVLLFYKTAYLERCYKAINEGTTFDDAKVIFDFFNKQTVIKQNEKGDIYVVIEIGDSKKKHRDFEKKEFLYQNGVMVEKAESYHRTYTTHY